MEEWKDIIGYEGLYQVSNEGRVRSLKFSKQKILKKRKTLGYYSVKLYKNGVGIHNFIHRLVAQTFIPNPNNYPCVNHKDEKRYNNKIENLEWCSYKYNSNYGTRNKRTSEILLNREDLSKIVYQYALDGKLIKIWKSARECDRNGFKQSCVSKCCNGQIKKYKGYRWSYKPL